MPSEPTEAAEPTEPADQSEATELTEPAKQSEEEQEPAAPAEESGDEPAEEQTEESAKKAAADEGSSDESEVEQWLTKYAAGKVEDTKFVKASQAIAQALGSATSEEEKFAAGVALAAYGESERIPGLIESAKTEDMKRQLAGLLVWVPFDERVKLVDAIVSPETPQGELDIIIPAFASVSNPRGAGVFWKLAEHPNVDLTLVYRSFYQLVFDGDENYYNPRPIKKQNQKLADQLVASVPAVEKMGDNSAFLALALLNHMDQAKAKKLAATLVASDHSDEVKHLATRVQLRTQKYVTSDWGERVASMDRSHAVEALKSKDPENLTLVLKYLAFGESVLNADASGSERFQIAPYSYNQFASSDNRKEGTDKVFNPPTGMTKEMLDFKDVKLSDEGKAYVAYFRSLLDESADLKPLLDYHNQHTDDEQMNRLVVRAVAATKNDDLVTIVEKIYAFNEEENDDERQHADMYWTISPMDSENALKLLKRIRESEGVGSLRNY